MLTSDPLSWLEGVRDSAEAILGDRLFEAVAGLAVLYVGCIEVARVRLEAARVVTGIAEQTTKDDGGKGIGGQKGDGGMRKSDGDRRFCSTMFISTGVSSR